MKSNKQKHVKCDALVGYAWCRTSYTFLRSLSRAGLRVSVADSMKTGMSQGSKFAVERYVHTNPRVDPEKFIEDISRILRDCNAHFYMPSHDEGQIVAQYRDRLPEDVVIPLTTFEKLRLANDKMETARLASQLQVSTPELIPWSCPEDLGGIDFPVVIKLRRGSGSKGIFYADNATEAIETVNKLIEQYNLSPERYPVIQKRIYGQGWGVSCLYWEGKRIASFTHQRLREKTITGGTSTLRQSAHLAAIEEDAYKILDHLNWHGLAMVEFKWDPETERSWFIEINPRLWGSIALAVGCGVDFPLMTYVASTKGLDEAAKMFNDYKDGVVGRWYLGDLMISADRLMKFHPIEALQLMLPGKADIYDDIFWDDIGATVSEFTSYFVRFLKCRSMNPLESGVLG